MLGVACSPFTLTQRIRVRSSLGSNPDGDRYICPASAETVKTSSPSMASVSVAMMSWRLCSDHAVRYSRGAPGRQSAGGTGLYT